MVDEVYVPVRWFIDGGGSFGDAFVIREAAEQWCETVNSNGGDGEGTWEVLSLPVNTEVGPFTAKIRIRTYATFSLDVAGAVIVDPGIVEPDVDAIPTAQVPADASAVTTVGTPTRREAHPVLWPRAALVVEITTVGYSDPAAVRASHAAAIEQMRASATVGDGLPILNP